MRDLKRSACAALVVCLACHGHSTGSADSAGGQAAADSGKSSSAATPVTMAPVTARTIEETVTGTGEIDALDDERVRAPFNGLLTTLTVNIGDRVGAGQTIGSMIAENSDAALRGARSMVSAARTPAERVMAADALRVAEANIVHTPLVAPKAGVVIARPSSPGERLAQGDSVVSIAATGLMVFFADIAQSDLARVHNGDKARMALASRVGWIPGVVHNVMPADTGSTATMRVRIDLDPRAAGIPVGVFGTATIVVNQHVNVPSVPKAALLRDDITGTTQVALVDPHGIAHWTNVTPGAQDSLWVEIVTPRLAPGQRVITTGQVGLPDSTRVVAAAPDSSGGTSAGGGSGPSPSSNADGNPQSNVGRGSGGGSSAPGSQGGGTAPPTTGRGSSPTGAAAAPSPNASPSSSAGSSPQPQPTAPAAAGPTTRGAAPASAPAAKPAGRGSGKPPA